MPLNKTIESDAELSTLNSEGQGEGEGMWEGEVEGGGYVAIVESSESYSFEQVSSSTASEPADDDLTGEHLEGSTSDTLDSEYLSEREESHGDPDLDSNPTYLSAECNTTLSPRYNSTGEGGNATTGEAVISSAFAGGSIEVGPSDPDYQASAITGEAVPIAQDRHHIPAADGPPPHDGAFLLALHFAVIDCL